MKIVGVGPPNLDRRERYERRLGNNAALGLGYSEETRMIMLRSATGTGTVVVEALLSYLPTRGTSEYLYTRKKPLCLNSSLACIPISLTFRFR